MHGETILIVDDEKLIRWSLTQELSKAGYRILEADTMKQGLSIVDNKEPDLIILDQLLPDGTGLDLLHDVVNKQISAPVIMLTAVDRSETAVKAMKLGAIDYVTKPVNIEELEVVIERALESTKLKRQIAHFLKEQNKSNGLCGIIGTSPVMKNVFEAITNIARSNGTTVLITGETGTGKELAATAIHFLSERKNNPFMTVNCSALPESLIESELFGHEKGAFTDARNQKKGIFELADCGTILLDEIGDISQKIQVKLLRVLEQKTFQRIGGVEEITVDIRIIAATNQSLEKLLEKQTFRLDLYYRLNVASLTMPPLRDREDDILLLAEYFLNEFNTKFHKHFQGFTEEAKAILYKYHWPGNVRELRNVLERTVLLNNDVIIRAPHIHFMHVATGISTDLPQTINVGIDGQSLYELEKQALLTSLEKTGYNQTHAAKLLKISRDTLRYRMKKYNLLKHLSN
ncbi:MAG TPA: sigma-54 dependent transcriptional regulator [Bacteroidota bacterium]|nr:sigma-54 dependent transcriptional regulator [Bacteroidota bacterium]